MYKLKEDLSIENMIYEIRGRKVIFDRDLAKLYNVETRVLNQKVKRNIDRFPEEFCFQLDRLEFKKWISQFVISNDEKMSLRKLPYVFTEQGVAMLSAIIKSDIAVKTSIQIMNAFVKLRKYVSNELIEQKYINKMVFDHDNEIKLLQESFSKLEEKETVNHIFYEGQIYDAYSLLMDILSKAKNEIIIIDNYAGKELLDIIKDIKQNIKIVSSNIDSTLKKKYESQYSNVTSINNNTFHDRFIIIDRKELYNSGASFKDLGKKCFAINKIEDKEILSNIIKKIGEKKCTN